MYFLENEASERGWDPAALEPAAESRKEGRLLRSLDGEGLSPQFCCHKFKGKDEKTTAVTTAAVGQTQMITKTTEVMTGWRKWGVPYPRLGIWQAPLYAGRLPVELNPVAGAWHRFAEIKQNKDPLEKGDGESKRMRPTSSGGKGNMRKIAL